jgi:hypothetical protein
MGLFVTKAILGSSLFLRSGASGGLAPGAYTFGRRCLVGGVPHPAQLPALIFSRQVLSISPGSNAGGFLLRRARQVRRRGDALVAPG